VADNVIPFPLTPEGQNAEAVEVLRQIYQLEPIQVVVVARLPGGTMVWNYNGDGLTALGMLAVAQAQMATADFEGVLDEPLGSA
jgi:hypothetical protein